jgi:hypothetical protein
LLFEPKILQLSIWPHFQGAGCVRQSAVADSKLQQTPCNTENAVKGAIPKGQLLSKNMIVLFKLFVIILVNLF